MPTKIRQGEMIDPHNLLTAALSVRTVGSDPGPPARRQLGAVSGAGAGTRIDAEQLARARRETGR